MRSKKEFNFFLTVYKDKVEGSGDDSIVPGYALLAWAILPLKENRRGIKER
jgi:hypothetical protein